MVFGWRSALALRCDASRILIGDFSR